MVTVKEEILTFEEFLPYFQTRRIVPKYDSTTEQMPSHLWFEIDKATVDAALKALVQMITERLKGAPESDRELKHLDRTAQALAQVEKSTPIKVALLGAQGAGKSLMINALFDRDGLSLTGAAGAACTSSITRYGFFPKSTTCDDMFHAEILFFNRDKRESLLKEHARNYHHYHNDDDDSEDEDSTRVGTQRDEKERSQKDTAEDIFITLFGSVDAFLASWSVAGYRSGEFVRLCQMKCEETLKQANVDSNNITTKMAANQKDLVDQLRPFLTNVKGKICLWPLVDNIAVKFYHPLLHGGIELFDLPGWGDINLSRVRHAQDIKNTVDVEIILSDTIRVSTDDKLINSARAAVSHHGASNVKVVTTKIDALSNNELAKCDGPKYKLINDLLNDLDEQEAAMDAAEDDDDDDDDAAAKKRRQFESYRKYLERARKQTFILTRAENLTTALASKLQGRAQNDMPHVFHASASDYMDWTKKPKIAFANQPALPVEMTGVPAIRQFLYALPAEQNLRDYERHLYAVVPNFLEKIMRAVRETERDAEFRTIADDIDTLRNNFMSRLLSEAKTSFRDASKNATSQVARDKPTLKEQLAEKLTEEWFIHKSAAWTRILRYQGVVEKGTSRAKGLENGCHWDRDLAQMLTAGFSKWKNTHSARMKDIIPALHHAIKQLHNKTVARINDSSANLVVAEKVKRKWSPLRDQLRLKLTLLKEKVDELEQRMFERATMQYGDEDSLIADLTHDMYDFVLESEPELKPPNPALKKQYKRYVTPKLRFQKKEMENQFLNPDDHFIDRIFQHFQKEFDDGMQKLIEEWFASMEKLLTDFSTAMKSEAPIEYVMTADGEAIRAELAELIPQLEEKVTELQKMLPPRPKTENEQGGSSYLDGGSGDDGEEKLAAIIEKVAKRRKAEPAPATRGKKRIKSEPV